MVEERKEEERGRVVDAKLKRGGGTRKRRLRKRMWRKGSWNKR